MQTFFYMLFLLFFSMTVHAQSGKAYMDRFMAYSNWNEQLPTVADEPFIIFLNSNTPLAKKLRAKWLYQLARQKDWPNYLHYYQPSNDVGLQCFYHLANYYQGNTDKAFNSARKLWLTGDSQPGACNMLFDLWKKAPNFDEALITQRMILALEKRNTSLARYLLKQYQQPRLKDERQLILIENNPSRIAILPNNQFRSMFYLYGLKRMVSRNMTKAIEFWHRPETKHILTFGQQQSFIAHVALYKAMRDDEDAVKWFNLLNPGYYTDVILDWQIRLALKQENWQKVKKLIQVYQDKKNLCWQYWLARAEEKLGHQDEAKRIYLEVAKNRNYYGFLASLRLHQKLTFLNELPVTNTSILKPYQPFMNNVTYLYQTKQTLAAARLLNDFVLELPKADKTALLYWLNKQLKWYSRSLYLSSTDDMSNQLALRFPLAYLQAVLFFAKSYRVSPELVFAMIRQESSFREDVVSPAGARGLMQLMPTTASQIAKQKKIAYRDKEQLFSARQNIQLGVAYMQHLAGRFNQHPVLIAAAYNAGPGQVHRWLKNHSPKEVDVWIETLPWQETRNYLKNIMSFYAVYQYRMNHIPDLDNFLDPLV